MAVNRVEELLRKVALALESAGIPYAVIGGNAVAAWVTTVDEGAVRTTKDVDILLRRDDLRKAAKALQSVGLIPFEVLGVHMFLDQENPSPKTGVHVVIAGEVVRPHYAHPAPDSLRTVNHGNLHVIDLPALVEMKLQSYRFIDRAHIQDLISVGLIDDELRKALPPDLGERLRLIEECGEQDLPA